jgi:hypothetical protein
MLIKENAMRTSSRFARSAKIAAGLIGVLVVFTLLFLTLTNQVVADEAETVDHSTFPQLQEAFATGPDVTTACLECHQDTAKDVMMTTHWTWGRKK